MHHVLRPLLALAARCSRSWKPGWRRAFTADRWFESRSLQRLSQVRTRPLMRRKAPLRMVQPAAPLK